MIKKLISLLFLATAAHAFSPVRQVQISTNTLSRQSGAFNVTGGSLTFVNTSTLTVTATVGAALPMGSNKITGLANGSAATDAAAYGQIGAYAVLCSSTVTISSSTASALFVPSNLGCSAALSNSAHHIYITASGGLQGSGTPSGCATTAAVFVDGANMDASTYGQCVVQMTVAGLTLAGATCPFLEYYAPGDTNTHAYRVYFSAASNPGCGTAIFGPGPSAARFVVYEVP